jgi:hypothetical protein
MILGYVKAATPIPVVSAFKANSVEAGANTTMHSLTWIRVSELNRRQRELEAENQMRSSLFSIIFQCSKVFF